MSKTFRKRAYAKTLGVRVDYLGKVEESYGFTTDKFKVWGIGAIEGEYLHGYAGYGDAEEKMNNDIFKYRIDLAYRELMTFNCEHCDDGSISFMSDNGLMWTPCPECQK